MRRGQPRRTTRHEASLATAIAALALLACACRSAECPAELDALDGRCVERKCDPCGTHEICDTSDSPAQCRCAPGYDGDPCAFVGLIVDPGFRGLLDPISGEPAWVGSKGAVVSGLAPGDDDTGEGLLLGDVICDAGDLMQVVEMPSYDAAQPLLVDVTYRVEVDGAYEGAVPGLAVGFHRSWKQLPPTGASWRNEVFCLGEGGYGVPPNGSPVEVRLSATEALLECEQNNLRSGVELRIDSFTIRPDEELACPVPGGVINAIADVEGTPWRGLPTDAPTVLQPGVGREGTDGARLSREDGATEVATTMSTQISVPLPSSVPSPALTFWWRGTTQELFQVELGTLVGIEQRGRQVDTLVGTINTQVADNRGERSSYCLPPWTHGTVLDLSFSLPEGTEPVELVVDDLAITSDEDDCGPDEDLFDPGFDNGNRWFGAFLGSSEGQVLIQDTDGSGVLELRYARSDAEVAMETYVLVPESNGGGGPALRFDARSPTPPSAEVRARIGEGDIFAGDVAIASAWAPNEICLPPQWTGRWFRVQVGVEPADISGAFVDQERVFLDSFSLNTSPDCPAE